LGPAITAHTAKSLNWRGKQAKSPPPRGANNICRGGGTFALEVVSGFDMPVCWVQRAAACE